MWPQEALDHEADRNSHDGWRNKCVQPKEVQEPTIEVTEDGWVWIVDGYAHVFNAYFRTVHVRKIIS